MHQKTKIKIKCSVKNGEKPSTNNKEAKNDGCRVIKKDSSFMAAEPPHTSLSRIQQ